MIRLSVNVLSSSIALIERLNTFCFSSLPELSYSKIDSIAAEDVFEFAQKCGWVSAKFNELIITDRGYKLLGLHSRGCFLDVKRQMLSDYVLLVHPLWANRIPHGRSEAAIFMSKDEKACFFEAGLLSDCLEIDVVNWWDSAAEQIRKISEKAKNDAGRTGERYTIEYEKKRTAVQPKWISIDSNLVGYDVKSRRSKHNPETLLIEVKTSSLDISHAYFYISSLEWSAASASGAYVFYLWCLNGNSRSLAIITPNEVRPYIPTNNLEGKWESAKIPFDCFQDKFFEVE